MQLTSNAHQTPGAECDERGWSVSSLFYALLPRDRLNALLLHGIESAPMSTDDLPPSAVPLDGQESGLQG